jgi:hypothetical protein
MSTTREGLRGRERGKGYARHAGWSSRERPDRPDGAIVVEEAATEAALARPVDGQAREIAVTMVMFSWGRTWSGPLLRTGRRRCSRDPSRGSDYRPARRRVARGHRATARRGDGCRLHHRRDPEAALLAVAAATRLKS